MTLKAPVYELNYKEMISSQHFCNGAPATPSTRQFLLNNNGRLDRETESRPKPGSLIQAQTAQELVWNYTSHAGFFHAIFPGYSAWCSGINDPAASVLHGYEYPLHSGHFSRPADAPSPDWMTPLRLQLQDAYVNIGADVGEYRQTVDMFKQAGAAVLNGWRTLKGKHRGSRRRKKLSLCHVADAELIYSFGIAPLVGSLFNSYMALKYRIEGPIYFKYVQSATETNTGYITDGKYEMSSSYKVSKHAKVYVQYHPGSMITLGNPLSLAWELVPYSFLFDYMIPIGETLMALDAMKGVADMFGTLTTRTEIKDETSQLIGAWAPGYIEQESRPAGMTWSTHERERITSIPLPPFPKWKPSASYHKLRHSVSLLVGANQKCRSRSRVPPRGRGGFGRRR